MSDLPIGATGGPRPTVTTGANREAGGEEGASINTNDQVSVGERGREAATHTGALGARARQSQDLGNKIADGSIAGQGAHTPQPAVQAPGSDGTTASNTAATVDPTASATTAPPQGTGQGGNNPGGIPNSTQDAGGDPTQPQPQPGPGGPGGPGGQGPTPNPPPSGGPGGSKQTAIAQQLQVQSQDALNAQAIYYQMAADRQKAQMDIWKILQDMQTWIFQKMQEAMIYRQQVQDKMSEKWAAVLGGASS